MSKTPPTKRSSSLQPLSVVAVGGGGDDRPAKRLRCDDHDTSLPSNPATLPSRASSVPINLFPSSQSIPLIDLRNPPPSPRRRARSHSSTKEGEPCIFSRNPPQILRDAMDVDQTAPESLNRPSQVGDSHIAHFSLPLPALREPPATPSAARQPTTLFSMSPLTPIPETPFSAMRILNKNRYVSDWSPLHEDEEQEQDQSSSLASSLPGLPRAINPQPFFVSDLALKASSSGCSSSQTVEELDQPTQKLNVFETLMRNASSKEGSTNSSRKGKTKAVYNLKSKASTANPPSVASFFKSKDKEPTSVTSATNATDKASSFTFKGRARNEIEPVNFAEKGKQAIALTSPSSKQPIKSRMKPRTALKQGVRPVPLPVVEHESKDESQSRPKGQPPESAEESFFIPPTRQPLVEIHAPKDVGESFVGLPDVVETREARSTDSNSTSLFTPPPEQAEGASQSVEPVGDENVLDSVTEAPKHEVLPITAVPTSSGQGKSVDSAGTTSVQEGLSMPSMLLPAKEPVAKIKAVARKAAAPWVPTARVTRSASSRRRGSFTDTKVPKAKTLMKGRARTPGSTSASRKGRWTESAVPVPSVLPSGSREREGIAQDARTLEVPSAVPELESEFATLRNDLSSSSLSDPPTDPPAAGPALPPRHRSQEPGSPMRVDSSSNMSSAGVEKKRESSLMRPTASSVAKQVVPKTPAKSQAKSIFKKPGTPSPTKIARSKSLINTVRPVSVIGMSRTSSNYIGLGLNGPPTSLSTLSSALEKLKMPPPGRPNSSLGFNYEREGQAGSDDGPSKAQLQARADGADLAGKTEKGRVKMVQQTLMATKMGARPSLDSNGVRAGPFGKVSTVMRGPAGRMGTGTGTGQVKIYGVGGRSVLGGGTRGGNWRAGMKASRRTSLPTVEGSPVKGGGVGQNEDGNVEIELGDVEPAPTASASGSSARRDESVLDLTAGGPSGQLTNGRKGRETGREMRDAWLKDASRRVSLASQALSQSLSALPQEKSNPALGMMGPPETPRKEGQSGSSNYSTSKAMDAGRASNASPSIGTRRSLRNAEKAQKARAAAPMQTNGDVNGKKGEGKGKEKDKDKALEKQTLGILNGCTVFVDVRNADGDEVGSLFVEMLEGSGAKILTRVGQRCTHIVFKNGVMSTLTRYRLLRDPKPLVVGIGWVVACVEQMKHVDESGYLVNLDGVNVAGTNKRRRSMLPKLITGPDDDGWSSEAAEGDISVDGSNSSMLLDDDLTPLERARLRKVKT